MIEKYTSAINGKKFELMETLFRKEANDQKLNALADELGHLNSAFEKARIGHIIKFRNILTDSQFDFFRNIAIEAYRPKPDELDRGGPPPEFDERHPDEMPPPPPNNEHGPGEMPPPPPEEK